MVFDSASTYLYGPANYRFPGAGFREEFQLKSEL